MGCDRVYPAQRRLLPRSGRQPPLADRLGTPIALAMLPSGGLASAASSVSRAARLPGAAHIVGKGRASPRSMKPTLVASTSQLRAPPLLGLEPRIAAIEFDDAGALAEFVIIVRAGFGKRPTATTHRSARDFAILKRHTVSLCGALKSAATLGTARLWRCGVSNGGKGQVSHEGVFEGSAVIPLRRPAIVEPDRAGTDFERPQQRGKPVLSERLPTFAELPKADPQA